MYQIILQVAFDFELFDPGSIALPQLLLEQAMRKKTGEFLWIPQ